MEKNKPVNEVINFARCIGEYAVLYYREKKRDFQNMVDDAMDIDFGNLEEPIEHSAEIPVENLRGLYD